MTEREVWVKGRISDDDGWAEITDGRLVEVTCSLVHGNKIRFRVSDADIRADGAAPDESGLRAACEEMLKWWDNEDGGDTLTQRIDALRAALAATEPAETCGACRWKLPKNKWDSCAQSINHPIIHDDDPACKHFERWPG